MDKKHQSKLTNNKMFQDGRTMEARRIRDLMEEFEEQAVGGLTPTQKHIARRLAGLITLAELIEMDLAGGYAVDQREYNRTINLQCRLFQQLGQLNPPPNQGSSVPSSKPKDGLADYCADLEENFDLPVYNVGRKPSKKHRVRKITR